MPEPGVSAWAGSRDGGVTQHLSILAQKSGMLVCARDLGTSLSDPWTTRWGD